VVAGNAVNEASIVVRRKIMRTASEHFECAEEDLVLADGCVGIVGVPGKTVSLGALARMANPLRGAVAPGTEPGLEATNYFGPESGATAAGAHAMVVEVDLLTMIPRILRYAVVHDCGVMINPLIVKGQIQGGVAQGIGNAFFEQLVFDGEAQLLNASLADFLLPTSLDVPSMEIAHFCTPSPLNPLGIKGVGEAGAIPGGALFAQALDDALGIEVLDIPLSPQRLWELTRAANG
jgi:CO/xanthine dehydrogenase Mo-binding subunit